MAEQTSIRGLDQGLFREVGAEAKRHGVTVGTLVNLILSEWLQEHDCATTDGPLPTVPRRTPA